MATNAGQLTTEQAEALRRAFAALQGGKVRDALALARRVADGNPRSADAHHLLALCFRSSGSPADAEASFRRALDVAPRHPEILGNFANFLKGSGRVEHALEIYRRAVEAAPGSAQAWINLGLAALAARKHIEALDAVERAVGLAPSSGLAWHALGRARRARGDLEGSAAAFRRATALEPRKPTGWINLGVVLRLLGRPAEALPAIEKARAAGFAGPELPDAYSGALIDLGRIEEALDVVRLLTREAPHYTAGQVTLAHLLWEYGEELAPDEDPFAAFRQAALAQPGNAELQLAFLRFLMEAGRATEALERARTLRTASSAPALAIVEANALDALGQTEASGALYEKLSSVLGAADPAFLNAWIRHLLKAGRWDEAAARGIEATAADFTNQEAWGYLATAWRLMDDPREQWLCDYDRAIAMVEVEPPASFAGAGDFAAAFEATLDRLHRARREPVNQSLRGGSQTPGRLFGRPDPVIAAAQEAVTRAVERHVANLPDDARHPFYGRKQRSISFVGSWSVKLRSSGRHISHFHPQGWMSSAYYVSLPQSVTAADDAGGRSGWIQFGQPPEDLGLDLAPRHYLRPRVGEVALFPSYMWHGTVPFDDPEPRVTVAFDMLPVD